MIKYANKYPHPGPRPAEEAEPATFTGDAVYKAWAARAARMQEWQTKMKQHAIAAALDDHIEQMNSKLRGVYDGAQIAVFFSLLQEPLPPELFP